MGVEHAHTRDIASELLLSYTPPPYRAHEFWADIGGLVYPYQDGLSPAPPLDAPLGLLADHDWSSTFRDKPSELTDPLRMRLLEACEAYPWYAADLVQWIPQTPGAFARIKDMLNKTPESKFQDNSKRWVIAYVSQRSPYFRPRLVEAAKGVREGEGWVNNVDDLRALARLDWHQAVPILRAYAASPNPRTAALALSLQYEHAAEAHSAKAAILRQSLRAIAEDHKAKGYARNFAIASLMSNEWTGRDQWFLSLLGDQSLHSLVDNNFAFSPLEHPVHREPSKWIPRIAPLANSPDTTARRGAIYILVSFQDLESRPDAALPLLPWLYNPNWVHVGDSGHDRRNLIYSLSKMRLPESIPGLLHVLANPAEASVWELECAANALGQYHDARVAPLLRRVVEQPLDLEERKRVARVLLASGELTLDEKAQTAEALLRQFDDSSAREELGKATLDSREARIPASVILGLVVLQAQGDDSQLRERLRKRAAELRRSDAHLAEQFDSLLAVLPEPDRDRRLVEQIKEGRADVATVQAALKRAGWLRKSVPSELREVANGQGAPAGVAAALLGDEARVFEILDGHDRDAQSALLASALFGGVRLIDQQVEKLWGSSDEEIAEAAGTYYQSTHGML